MANVVFVWILMQAYVIPMFSRLTNIVCCWDRGHNLRLESFQRIWDIDGQKWEKKLNVIKLITCCRRVYAWNEYIILFQPFYFLSSMIQNLKNILWIQKFKSYYKYKYCNELCYKFILQRLCKITIRLSI